MSEQYSLWLLPPPEQYKRLQRVISKLSQQYSTPLLEPHVTLYGRIIDEEAQIIDTIRELAGRLSPPLINFNGFSLWDEFFRSIFMEAERTAELEQAYQAAHTLFEPFLHPRYRGREFIPHLSLMYGNIPTEEKGKIIASLDRDLLTSFLVDNVSLYRLRQEPAEWVKVRDFAFRNILSS
ncbi:MAG: 2'-5' RNA ligase family protein [Nanoarchaeota archaeon]|nr:2'-5' RNA ligase family protein [Nanoarchaeota archaeon]